MFQNYFLADLAFIKSLYNVTNLLGLTPFYSFSKTSCKKINLKIYATCVYTILLIGTIYSLVNRHNIYYNEFIKTYIVLDFANDIILFISITAAILYACIFQQDQWFKLNQNIQIIDGIILSNFEICSKSNFNSVYVSFCRVALFIFVRCYVNYIWCPHLGYWTCIQTYLFYNIMRFYEAILMELVINLTQAFKWRYKRLNNKLQNIKSKNLSEEIKIVGIMSRRLIETLKCFNLFFGWTLFFTLGHEVVQLLECLNYLISVITLQDKSFGTHIAIENVLQGTYTLVISMH